MKKKSIMQRTTAIIMAAILLLTYAPSLWVHGEAIEGVSINLKVVDSASTNVLDGRIEVNGIEVPAIKNENVYTINLTGYDTDSLKIKVYNGTKAESAKVVYVKGTTDYDVALYKHMSIGNSEAVYNEEKDVYEINKTYSMAVDNYELVVNADTVINYTLENIDDISKLCDGRAIEARDNGAKLKYTSPGTIRIKCEAQGYKDEYIELNLSCDVAFKYVKALTENKYEIKFKENTNEITEVKIKDYLLMH